MTVGFAAITGRRLGTCQLQASCKLLVVTIQKYISSKAQSNRTEKDKEMKIRCKIMLRLSTRRSHLMTSRKLDVGRQLPNSVVKIAGQVGRTHT